MAVSVPFTGNVNYYATFNFQNCIHDESHNYTIPMNYEPGTYMACVKQYGIDESLAHLVGSMIIVVKTNPSRSYSYYTDSSAIFYAHGIPPSPSGLVCEYHTDGILEFINKDADPISFQLIVYRL